MVALPRSVTFTQFALATNTQVSREVDDSKVIYSKNNDLLVIIFYGSLTSSCDANYTGYHSLTHTRTKHQVPSSPLPGDWVGIMDGEGVTLAW